ncbi:MAG: hypothetical protein A3C82_00105 [Candidatus Wildermuthbacteria bacterium RIFCSPHIGHO2_02_FULL_47_12]|uniref:HhH-GPD domain-containing protein n=1 Tax=Candidatus Wildermuthbacteria bacterium RIFCSPHIGHO2_02_FULL_47_12 TaxID=1802451 RepID=A0A1G2R352_9BACT|nr:MAG: hypothetical protein A3C82_00105 [Candidatus Wildermuthbacteria bacterium RIFCSPHIGHO2_02_FULL_47_12]
MTILEFQKYILSWYKTHRRNLPWRNTRDPYKILISEVMLQQTQVARVLPKYKEFLQKFPTLEKLAQASDKTLLKVWQGLGYWRRAKYLKETAHMLVKAKAMNLQTSPRRPASTVSAKGGVAGREHRLANFAGNLNSRSFKIPLPSDLEILPGIGPYTARALACFAFGSTEAFLDTNIRRVYLHFFFPKRKDVPDTKIFPIAQKAVWNKNAKEWHYALFDYGATVLKDKKINKRSRHYAKQSKFEGSFRSFRTKVMRFLLDQQDQIATKSRIKRLLKEAQSPYTSEKILAALEKDGLIKKRKGLYSL